MTCQTQSNAKLDFMIWAQGFIIFDYAQLWVELSLIRDKCGPVNSK